MAETDPKQATTERLRAALHQVVLLRETGPKSAAWHRARVQTIWRLHTQLEQHRDVEASAECSE